MRKNLKSRRIAAVAIGALLALSLAACSGGGTPNPGQATGAAPQGGSGEPVTITVWGWDATVEKAIPGFEAANPNIKVKVVNAGSSSDEYTALDNAIQAGSGVPDVAMFEYFALPYFAIPGKLADLDQFGATDFSNDYVPAAWTDVTVGGKIYALPSDYGPVVMFYNNATFKKAGIDEPPATWDEYYQDAKKIHDLGKDYYIQNDSGDPFLLMSLIWQAGGHPFAVDGTSTTINFADAGTAKAVSYWQKMLDEGLINTKIANWSDDWNRTLNNGELATQVIGGWLTSTLPERAPDTSGDWRVAPMPQWDAGATAGSENGGSCFGVPAAAAHQAEGYKFLEYFAHGEGLQNRVDAGAFVPNTSVLNSDAFQTTKTKFFGDQTTGTVLAKASEAVTPGWQYPPFFEWARTNYADVVTPYYTSGKIPLLEILDTWKKNMTDYGNEQGFQVS